MSKYNNKREKIPDVSIEEALELYLRVVFPDGIPEGMDKEILFNILKEKIKQDRPEWANKYDKNNEKSAITKSEEKLSYTDIKFQIIKNASKDDGPTDPEERYFYERKKEADSHREKRKNEMIEEIKNEEMIKNILKNKKGSVDTQLLLKASNFKSLLIQQLNPALNEKSITNSKTNLEITNNYINYENNSFNQENGIFQSNHNQTSSENRKKIIETNTNLNIEELKASVDSELTIEFSNDELNSYSYNYSNKKVIPSNFLNFANNDKILSQNFNSLDQTEKLNYANHFNQMYNLYRREKNGNIRRHSNSIKKKSYGKKKFSKITFQVEKEKKHMKHQRLEI